MPRISNGHPKGALFSPANSLEPCRSLPSALGHSQPQINPLNFDYCTAMHLAAYYGHWPVIKILIESGTCDLGQLFSNRNAQVDLLKYNVRLNIIMKVFAQLFAQGRLSTLHKLHERETGYIITVTPRGEKVLI